MAQKTTITLIDDVDGSEATETIPFGLDGVEYEIDLSDENATSLRASLDAYVSNARQVGAARRRTSPARKMASTGSDTKAVREWAKQNNLQVSERGRVSSSLIAQFQEAQS